MACIAKISLPMIVNTLQFLRLSHLSKAARP
jgi:hypothetical protein